MLACFDESSIEARDNVEETVIASYEHESNSIKQINKSCEDLNQKTCDETHKRV